MEVLILPPLWVWSDLNQAALGPVRDRRRERERHMSSGAYQTDGQISSRFTHKRAFHVYHSHRVRRTVYMPERVYCTDGKQILLKENSRRLREDLLLKHLVVQNDRQKTAKTSLKIWSSCVQERLLFGNNVYKMLKYN